MRLPFVGGVVGKGKGELFPKYTSGIYTENGTEMIVSRGGETTIRKSRGFLTRPRSCHDSQKIVAEGEVCINGNICYVV